MDVRLDDGTIIKNVPDNMTKAELNAILNPPGVGDVLTKGIPQGVRQFGQDVRFLTEAAGEKVGINPEGFSQERRQQDIAQRQAFSETPVGVAGENFAINAGQALVSTGQGVKQQMARLAEKIGIASPGATQNITDNIRQERNFFESQPASKGPGSTAGQVAGTVAPFLPVPGFAGNSVPKRILGNALVGAGVGATQFAESDNQALVNAGLGAFGGAIGAELLIGLSKKVSNVINRIRPKQAQKRVIDTTIRRELADQVPSEQLEEIIADVQTGLTPEQALNKMLLQKLGQTPTRGQITGDLDELRIEQEAIRRSGNAADLDQSNRRALRTELDARVADISPDSPNSFDAGTAAQTELRGARDALKTRESDAFDAATERVRKLPGEVNAKNALETMEELQDVLTGTGAQPVLSLLRRKGFIDSNGDFIDQALNPEQASVFLKDLTRLGGPNEAGVLSGKIKRALTQDIERDLGEDVFRGAKNLRFQRLNRFDKANEAGKVAQIIDGTVAPEDIVPKMLGKNFKVDDVEKLFNQLDQINPSTANQLRASALDNVFRSATGALDNAGVAQVTPSRFQRRIQQTETAKLVRIFGKKTAKELQQLPVLLTKIARSDKRIQNPGTADEVFRRISDAQGIFGSILSEVPLASVIPKLSQVINRSVKDKQSREALTRALNVEALKREQLLGIGPDFRLGVSAVPGTVSGVER